MFFLVDEIRTGMLNCCCQTGVDFPGALQAPVRFTTHCHHPRVASSEPTITADPLFSVDASTLDLCGPLTTIVCGNYTLTTLKDNGVSTR